MSGSPASMSGSPASMSGFPVSMSDSPASMSGSPVNMDASEADREVAGLYSVASTAIMSGDAIVSMISALFFSVIRLYKIETAPLLQAGCVASAAF